MKLSSYPCNIPPGTVRIATFLIIEIEVCTSVQQSKIKDPLAWSRRSSVYSAKSGQIVGEKHLQLVSGRILVELLLSTGCSIGGTYWSIGGVSWIIGGTLKFRRNWLEFWWNRVMVALG